MSHSLKSLVSYPALALAAMTLAACGDEAAPSSDDSEAVVESSDSSGDTASSGGTLFASDFEDVCSGATVSRATAYEPGSEDIKAVYLETYESGMIDRSSSSLPEDWTVEFSAEEDAYAKVSLVLCGKRTGEKQIKTCDGYKSDGEETDNKVNLHTATYEMTLIEATTGEEVAKTTVEANSDRCPMMVRFESTSDTVDEYARPEKEDINTFLKPHITG